MNNDLLIYGVAGLAFVAIAGVGLVLAGGSNDQAIKRAKLVSSNAAMTGKRQKGRGQDDATQRRKQTQQMLDKLREDGKKKRKSLVPQDTQARIQQAGLDFPVPAFWVFSVIMGIIFAVLTFMSGAEGPPSFQGITIKNRPLMIIGAGVAGTFGVPRWLLDMVTKSRYKKLTAQFADAVDMIVRGVKSGLPLTECLRIIAKESPSPLGPEFKTLVDAIQMGVPLDGALQKLYHRMPLPEINFFVIVLTIQAKAGGNLSEALGNLSIVIRSRKMMREKIKALSSEAKSSAMIIGVLPFAVGIMVFVTTPDYIMVLFTTSTGHMIIAMGAFLMGLGIMTMRKMINFDI
ncbi:MAG: type II secretion system F family protein [Hyphomonadaceae bacterium]